MLAATTAATVTALATAALVAAVPRPAARGGATAAVATSGVQPPALRLPVRGIAPVALRAWRHQRPSAATSAPGTVAFPAVAARDLAPRDLAPRDLAPRVSLWTDRDDPYRRGDAARVYVSVREPSYVAVLRVDTDGAVRVLFPRDPWADSWVRSSRVLELRGAGRGSFLVDDYPGLGYLFAVASPEPLDFDPLVRRDQWDYHELDGGRLRSDPYVALTGLAEQLAPDGNYDYDIATYAVGQRYEYPRFVCYDCHTAATAAAWDPYREACSRYRIVIYDDPYYYPYRTNG
ncbi:MAG TPA: DUF4384 domain-containing protein, partial [Gemmatimonadales bacterium]|nr:DUF4384 domain-containing protein [Gemmatimonadales bacterium]